MCLFCNFVRCCTLYSHVSKKMAQTEINIPCSIEVNLQTTPMLLELCPQIIIVEG